MNLRSLSLALVATVAFWTCGERTAQADDYIVDAAHSSATFRISHLGLSWTHGRFNDLSGTFSTNPAVFTLIAKTESIDTGNEKRDEHLKSPDFLNVKQFPEIKFQSTNVKPEKDGYEVTGQLTLHGVTRPVTIVLTGGKPGEFPEGVQRTGYSGDLVIKRSAFGISKFAEIIGDEVHISLSFEGTKKTE